MSTATKTTRRNYYRRKSVAKRDLSLDWLRSQISLTDKDRQTLAILAKHRLMSIDQLMYWHPDFGRQKRAKALLQRHINRLHQFYLIDKKDHLYHQQLDGTTKRTIFVSLGELGVQAVGWRHYPRRIRYHSNGSVSITPRYYHIARVCDLSILTNELFKKMGLEIEWWEVECKALIGHPNQLSPDALCVAFDHQTGKRFSFFIEFDTGSDDVNRKVKFPKLNKKFNRYREVKLWDDFYTSDISRISANPFPYLMFVTEEKRRFPLVPRLLEEKKIDASVCMITDYPGELKKVIERMRKTYA
ncbi:replication-relaxation family protein [Thermoactinomyces sp. FSL K6-2592]|jgi:hypothetical protein|uniref:replication-relaxation family protein n=1 Tax=Thermoactinomyces sp. FSL K6-2592 TaxID=2975347 RepID=UPI0030FB7F59